MESVLCMVNLPTQHVLPLHNICGKCVVHGKPPTQHVLPLHNICGKCVVHGKPPTQHILPPTQLIFESVLCVCMVNLPTQHVLPPTQHRGKTQQMFESVMFGNIVDI